MLKPPLSSTSNGPHSSAFFTFEKQAASLNDLDIVRKIVEREGCLEALAQLLTTATKTKGPTTSTEIDQVYPYTYPRRGTITSSAGSSSTASPMVVHSLLDQLRSVSIQTVEAIKQWRATTQLQVFQWRQVNYLLKMTSDLDFLATTAVHVDTLQQLPRLERNPFLAPLHLDHPALREKLPDAAIQLGVYVGTVDMKRVFYASKVLLRELEMEKKKQLVQKQQQGGLDDDEDDGYGALSPMNGLNNPMAVVDPSVLAASKYQPQQHQMRVHWSNQEVKGSSASSLSSPYPAKQALLLGSDSSTAEPPPRDRKEAMGRDLELCRELILHAEHELGAIREEVAILQEKLADTLARPERRRKLQNKIGALINALKFKSGDLYQRKNELRRKEAVYRLQCERSSAGSSSSGRIGRVDKLTRSQRASSGSAADQCENGRRSPESSQNLHPYLSAVESAMQEDELRRQEIVEKFMTLAKMRAVTATSSTSRQKHKQQLTRNASHPSPSFKLHATIGSFSPHSQASGQHLMTTDEVSTFIDSLDLGCSYGAKFRSQGIDGALLLQANDQDLEEIGVTIRLHRVRILEAIASLKASR